MKLYSHSKTALICSLNRKSAKWANSRKSQVGLLESGQFPLNSEKVCLRERQADTELREKQSCYRPGERIKWEDKPQEDQREKRKRFGKCYDLKKKKEKAHCSGRYTQRQSDGLEKKMKGKIYQKEWYMALQQSPTRSINLHHSSVLLEINSFHWLLLYLWVTIRDKPSAAMMTELLLQRGGARWGRRGVTNTSSCLPWESNE